MNNEMLGYIKDAIYAFIVLLLAFGIEVTDGQVAAIMGFVVALGAIALAINSHRAGGAVQTIRNKAAAAEEAGIVTTEGPPPPGE